MSAHPDGIDRYFQSLITARSHIAQQQARTKQLANANQQGQQTLTRVGQAQQHMRHIQQQVQQLVQHNGHDDLDHEEEQLERVDSDLPTQSAWGRQHRELPAIEVGDTQWAEDYLSSITLQNLKQIETAKQLHGATMTTLNNTLVRYQHKLSQLEQELREFYRAKKSAQRRSGKIMQ